jgi:DNA-binding MarR family transcriptional regulator
LVTLGEMSSQEIATQLNITVNSTTTNLSVLRRRGLVRVLQDRRGRLGGSVWDAYDAVKQKYRR